MADADQENERVSVRVEKRLLLEAEYRFDESCRGEIVDGGRGRRSHVRLS